MDGGLGHALLVQARPNLTGNFRSAACLAQALGYLGKSCRRLTSTVESLPGPQPLAFGFEGRTQVVAPAARLLQPCCQVFERRRNAALCGRGGRRRDLELMHLI